MSTQLRTALGFMGILLLKMRNHPTTRLKKYLVPPKDLIWDLSGKGNRWDQPGASSFPSALPVGQAH